MGAQRGRPSAAAGRLVERICLQLFGRCVYAQLEPSAGRQASAAAGRLVGRVSSLTIRAVPLQRASLSEGDNVGMGAQRGRPSAAAGRLVERFVSNFSGGAFTHGWNSSAGRQASAAAGRLVGRARSLTLRAVPLRRASLAGDTRNHRWKIKLDTVYKNEAGMRQPVEDIGKTC